MEKPTPILNFVGGILTVAVLFGIMPVLTLASGALGGFFIGWWFDDTYAAWCELFGWSMPAWQTFAGIAFFVSLFTRVASGK